MSTNNADVNALAKSMRDDEALRNQPYLDAIAEVGTVIPDMVWNPRRGAHGEYVLAGEYEDVPRRYLTIPTNRSMFRGERLEGNADQIADTLRNRGVDASDGDVRDFLRNYRRVTIAQFIEDAREIVGNDAPNRVELIGEILENLGFEQGAPRWNRTSFFRDGIEVNVGPMTTCLHGADIAGVRRSLAGWMILKTSDSRAIEIAVASALFVAAAA